MKEILDKAAKAYYEGEPIMSDAQFDILSEHNSYEEVGYKSGFDQPHLSKMYSLQKVFVGEGTPPSFDGEVIVSPKLDGAAVSLVYNEGVLHMALTRGDGTAGNIITDKLRLLVPERINTRKLIQITGEVVAPKTIPNPRNYASGAINLKSTEEFSLREVRFVAYDLQLTDHEYWTSSLEQLASWGFDTVINSDWTGYPQDGLVFRINDRKSYEEMGYTSHHPRGAYALKERADGVVTKLIDVLWQVGKSGLVSPVAVLEPVIIGDANISRASLHNMRYITELGLEIGCYVEVIRSGDIIPRITRRV